MEQALLCTEHALLLGFVFPPIIPLACVVIWIRLCVVHTVTTRYGVPRTRTCEPPRGYLIVSLILGTCLIMWLFATDPHLDSAAHWIALIGAPVSICVGLLLSQCKKAPCLHGSQPTSEEAAVPEEAPPSTGQAPDGDE